jgi:tetratricopeptide (TPR) repeat protein
LDAWLTLAFAQFWAGPRHEALAAYERALAIDPEHLRAWTQKGILLSMLGRHEEALEAYDRALAIRQNGLGWAQRARTLRALGRDAEAEEAERHEQEFPR